jgi:DNA-binding phage protein
METQELVLTELTAGGKKIAALMELKKITPADLDNFNDDERQYLGAVCTKMLQGLKGEERDGFLDKIEALMPAANKQQIWEYNHQTITDAISILTQKYGSMPNKSQIAEETGLSRQTISKHLKEYQSHPGYAAEMEQFKIMTSKLMSKVFKFAVNGDMRAARLYLEAVGATNKGQGITVVNNQNNYIQINNTILSQENLKRLTAEQLNQIESVVAMVLPEEKRGA